MTKEELVGKWCSEYTEEFGNVTLEFKLDDTLIYTVREKNKTQTINLTYKLEDDYLYTDQPAAPKIEKSEISIQDRTLIIKYEGKLVTYSKMFPCPCCGMTEVVDYDYSNCDICGWENDPSQLTNPDMTGGANKLSLNQAREQFSVIGRKKEVIFDGNNFSNEEQFDHECKSVLTKDVEWVKGSEYVNLDSFNDFLSGGFGVIEYDEPYKIIWLNSEKSKRDLGYSEQVKHWKNILIACHPTAVEDVKNKINDAENNIGKTLFDEIIEIITDRDNNQIELILK